MRNFTMVSPRIWRSGKFKSLSQSSQLLFIYLLTNVHQNMGGAYRLPIAYGADDLAWTVDDFESALSEVVDIGLIHHDPETDEIVIAQWFKFNPPKGPKIIKGVENIIDKIESETLFDIASQYLAEAVDLQEKSNAPKGTKPISIQASQTSGASLVNRLDRKRDQRTGQTIQPDAWQ